ncbi:MAG TPA: hypothetical protein VI913_03890 [Candidatus Peribacteraceae bacterium]|nr:hypothetical protein [Candidatus Peribacteraceae bacterium]
MPPSQFPKLASKKDAEGKSIKDPNVWKDRCATIQSIYQNDARVSALEVLKTPTEVDNVTQARNNIRGLVAGLVRTPDMSDKALGAKVKRLMEQTIVGKLKEGDPTLNEIYAAIEVQLAKQKIPPEKMAVLADHLRRHKETVAYASIASGRLPVSKTKPAKGPPNPRQSSVKPASESKKGSFLDEGVSKPPSEAEFDDFFTQIETDPKQSGPMPDFVEEPLPEEPVDLSSQPEPTKTETKTKKGWWPSWLKINLGRKKSKSKTIAEAGGTLPTKTLPKNSAEAANQALGGTGAKRQQMH